MVDASDMIDNWAVLVDPGWQASHPDDTPPPEAMAGGWLLDDDGGKGPFWPNPDFVPRDNVTPTDPIDAVLRLLPQGKLGNDELLSVLRDGIVEIAMQDRDKPLVVVSPDGVRCVCVATAPAHRNRLEFQKWMALPGDRLVDVVPDGLDILLNPDGPAGFRLIADILREAGTDGDE